MTEPKPRRTRTRRDPLEDTKKALPLLPVDQLAEVCEALVHSSPRQALLLQTVLKEAIDIAKGGPRAAQGVGARPVSD